MFKFFFPSNLILKVWVFWILVECTLKISYEINSTNTFEGHFSDFLYGLVLAWFCGAMWSDFTVLSYLVIAAYLYIAFVVLFKIYELIPSVKVCTWFLFILAMFTIWVEPWITLSLFRSPEALLAFTPVQAMLSTLDAVFSLVWFFWTWLISDALHDEF